MARQTPRRRGPTRPLLLVDVDGVLSLFGGGRTTPETLVPTLVDGVPHLLSRAAADALQATSSETSSACGARAGRTVRILTCLFSSGSRAAGRVRFAGRASTAGTGRSAGSTRSPSPDRPLAWIDDHHDAACHAWARRRPGPTLLVPTDPEVGLTRGARRPCARVDCHLRHEGLPPAVIAVLILPLVGCGESDAATLAGKLRYTATAASRGRQAADDQAQRQGERRRGRSATAVHADAGRSCSRCPARQEGRRRARQGRQGATGRTFAYKLAYRGASSRSTTERRADQARRPGERAQPAREELRRRVRLARRPPGAVQADLTEGLPRRASWSSGFTVAFRQAARKSSNPASLLRCLVTAS